MFVKCSLFPRSNKFLVLYCRQRNGQSQMKDTRLWGASTSTLLYLTLPDHVDPTVQYGITGSHFECDSVTQHHWHYTTVEKSQVHARNNQASETHAPILGFFFVSPRFGDTCMHRYHMYHSHTAMVGPGCSRTVRTSSE